MSPPDDRITRPFTGRAKESVCNLLRGWFEDANVLDLFAGVGTMGLEAVSRGARNVVMVEKNPQVYGMLRENIQSLDCSDRATSIRGDALGSAILHRAPAPVDLIFADPPYPMMRDEASRRRVLDQLERCQAIMNPKGFIVLRVDVDPDCVPHVLEGFDGPEIHEYGRRKMRILLYQPSSDETTGSDTPEHEVEALP